MTLKKQVYSTPYNLIFENKYPSLLIGPGIYTKKEDVLNNTPKTWILKEKEEIEKLRSKQIFAYNQYSKNDAKDPKRNILEIQNLIKSYKETELEIDINSKKTYFSEKTTGINNKGYTLEKIKVTENIKVLKTIDKVTNDSSLKAKDAIVQFYEKTNDVYKLEQLLSMGLLGLKKDRMFLPTRWSITCIDDTLGKDLFEKIKTNKIIDRFKMHKFKFYDNCFYVFFLPYSWGFEMIEYTNNNVVGHDYEIEQLKKGYATSITGAYYSARYPVLEYLYKNNLCSRVIVLRDISQNYSSKGVWVIRESIIESLKTEEIIFNNLSEVIDFIKNNLKLNWILEKSEILKQIKFQKRIFDF